MTASGRARTMLSDGVLDMGMILGPGLKARI